jgi:hypothetical protein
VSVTTSDIALAGGQSTIIGIDVPTIAQTVLDAPKAGAVKAAEK